MVDAVLAVVALEAVVLLLLRRTSLLPNVLAGLLLLVAMRLAVGEAALPWVGVTLLAAGVVHAAELYRGWSQSDFQPGVNTRRLGNRVKTDH